MKHHRHFAWAALAIAAPLGAQQTSTQHYEAVSHAGEVDSTTQATDIALQKDEFLRMTVPVRVAGSGPYRFLIDTGADRTAISRDLVRLLRLESARTATLHSTTGESQVSTANVPVLDLAAKQVRNVDAAVLDAGHMGADGILGLDSLRSQRILFDFKKDTLTIVPSEVRQAKEKGTVVVTGRIRNGRLILTDAQADDVRLTVVVDTGAQVSVGNEALRQRLSRAGKLRNQGQTELISVTGQKLVGDYMVVQQLEVGGVDLKELPVVFVDSHAFRQLGLLDRPALLLGMNALRGFEKVSIDFARKKFRVVLPEKSSLQSRMVALR